MKKLVYLICGIFTLGLITSCGSPQQAPSPSADAGKPEVEANVKEDTEKPDKEEAAEKPEEASAEASAVGFWDGDYCKFVGDQEHNTEDRFRMELKADGTGTNYRDDLELAVTWTLKGSDFTMQETFLGATLEYTGTLEDGVIHLFNGDPKDDLTYEYYYKYAGTEDFAVDYTQAPPETEEPTGSAEVGDGSTEVGDDAFTQLAARYRGDWNGLVGFKDVTDSYKSFDEPVAAIARFKVDTFFEEIDPFIGFWTIDLPIEDLKARFDMDRGTMLISGKWDNIPFEDVEVKENNGTISFEFSLSGEDGNITFVVNMRRHGDMNWTNEDPGLNQTTAEYSAGMTFDELAEMIGCSPDDYPSPDGELDW